VVHAHDHSAVAAVDLGLAFKWAVILNTAYVFIEGGAGVWTGSLALLAAAAHNLIDIVGLLIVWASAWAAKRAPIAGFTYGFGKTTILAALANAIAILMGAGGVIWEAIYRFSTPMDLPALTVMAVALVGIGINAGTAFLFQSERGHDLNAEGAFLHMMGDAAVSGGVVISAGLLLLTGWTWLDPVAAILVSLVISWSAFVILKSALGLSLDAVPASIATPTIDAWLRSRPGVETVHDLHIWPLSTTKVALTAHLVMPKGLLGDAYLNKVAGELKHDFGIGHTTLQIEIGIEGIDCPPAQVDVV
jgi:cobalt-zinc-cadmium efflux system protein